MSATQTADHVDLIFGRFSKRTKNRLDSLYDYEQAQINAFRRAMDLIAPRLFLDVGANVGLYAIYMSYVPSIDRVMAFEPAPTAFQALEENAGLQSNHKITCFQEALSDQEADLQFSLFSDFAGNNSIQKTRIPSKEPESTITVRAVPLDKRLTCTETTLAMKVDIEGHEMAFLEGARAVLENNRVFLQVEAFPRHREQVTQTLRQSGFKKIFLIKDDLYFINFGDDALFEALQNIMFDEVGNAMRVLSTELRRRRVTIRKLRDAIDEIRFTHDPLKPR